MLTMIVALALALMGDLPADQQQIQDQKQRRHISERQFQLKDLQVVDVRLGTPDPESKEQPKLKCWVMDTNAKRMEGLMFVRDGDIDKDEGMVFVFRDSQRQSFWMMNTLIHLDIAYVNANYEIVKIYTMIAHDTTTDYTSVFPCKYVIEMKQGTMKRLGIKVGQKVQIPETVKAKD